jgi:iron complex transport system substrate-binding protein
MGGDLMAERIVSLIASATEIVCALGLRDRLVGISHECDYPPDVTSLPALSRPRLDPRAPGSEIHRSVVDLIRAGLSVYDVDADKLAALRPDLIVTQDQCAVCAVSLRDVEDATRRTTLRDTRVCSLVPHTLGDVLESVVAVARAAGVPERGEHLKLELEARLRAVAELVGGRARPRVAAVEWLEPAMIAGGWIPELVRLAGGDPVLVTEAGGPFLTLRLDDIAAADPDVVVVFPCGYPLEKTLAEARSESLRAGPTALPAVRAGRAFAVDGNAYFNRPGPRLVESAEILAALLYPAEAADWAARYAGSFAPLGVPAS